MFQRVNTETLPHVDVPACQCQYWNSNTLYISALQKVEHNNKTAYINIIGVPSPDNDCHKDTAPNWLLESQYR